MGSRGTGNFTDYPGSSGEKGKSSTKKDGASKPSGTGGSSGTDICDKSFSTNLEEVGRCAYYLKNNNVPPPKTPILVQFNSRPCIETINGELIGYLPTKFNYLVKCMQDGRSYEGFVKTSSTKPLPKVFVDINPI